MTRDNIVKQIHYHSESLEMAVSNEDWVQVKDSASKLNDLSYLLIEMDNLGLKNGLLLEAVNNSASLRQAECPNCETPFSRGDKEGTHICKKCGAKIHYRGFSSEEILNSLEEF